jgi:hypothetical protein
VAGHPLPLCTEGCEVRTVGQHGPLLGASAEMIAHLTAVLGEFQSEIQADDTAAIVLTRVADASEPAIAQMAEVRQTVKTN